MVSFFVKALASLLVATPAMAQTPRVGAIDALPETGVFVVERVAAPLDTTALRDPARITAESRSAIAEVCLRVPVVMAPGGDLAWVDASRPLPQVVGRAHCSQSGPVAFCTGAGVISQAGSGQAGIVSTGAGFALVYQAETRIFHRCDGPEGLSPDAARLQAILEIGQG